MTAADTMRWARIERNEADLVVQEKGVGGWAPLVAHVALAVILCLIAGCRSPYYADQGAALGGMAGAVTGAALGDHDGNAATGAVLGGALGAMTGAAIGDSMDAEVARRQALIEQRTGRRMTGAVTTSDVMTLAASGLSDDVIMNHIRANGVAAPLTPTDIIQMHDSGVSEAVINTMQQTISRQTAPPPVPYGGPVIVEERYVTPPCWTPPYYYHRPAFHMHARPRPGFRWGFSVRN